MRWSYFKTFTRENNSRELCARFICIFIVLHIYKFSVFYVSKVATLRVIMLNSDLIDKLGTFAAMWASYCLNSLLSSNISHIFVRKNLSKQNLVLSVLWALSVLWSCLLCKIIKVSNVHYKTVTSFFKFKICNF